MYTYIPYLQGGCHQHVLVSPCLLACFPFCFPFFSVPSVATKLAKPKHYKREMVGTYCRHYHDSFRCYFMCLTRSSKHFSTHFSMDSYIFIEKREVFRDRTLICCCPCARPIRTIPLSWLPLPPCPLAISDFRWKIKRVSCRFYLKSNKHILR